VEIQKLKRMAAGYGRSASPERPGSVLAMTLDADLAGLLAGKNFAAFTTLMADGQPQTQIMWIGDDGEHLLINTEVHRQKFKNAQRDPRVTATIFNADNAYQYIEARGHVVDTVGGDEARAHIDALAKKYMGVDDYPNPIQSERVILKIAVDKIHKNGY
jgi:PPOX class probable F420-dependent enzyme